MFSIMRLYDGKHKFDHVLHMALEKIVEEIGVPFTAFFFFTKLHHESSSGTVKVFYRLVYSDILHILFIEYLTCYFIFN